MEEKKKIEEETDDEVEQRKMMESIRLYKYVGESSRSLYRVSTITLDTFAISQLPKHIG